MQQQQQRQQQQQQAAAQADAERRSSQQRAHHDIFEYNAFMSVKLAAKALNDPILLVNYQGVQ